MIFFRLPIYAPVTNERKKTQREIINNHVALDFFYVFRIRKALKCVLIRIESIYFCYKVDLYFSIFGLTIKRPSRINLTITFFISIS